MNNSESNAHYPRYPEDYVGLQAGYVKPASLAWYASHHHTAEGLNEPYQYSYLFAYSMGVSEGKERSHCLTTTKSAF